MNELIKLAHKPSTTLSVHEALKSCKFVALIFTANYGHPCRSFIKKYLLPFYKEINDEG